VEDYLMIYDVLAAISNEDMMLFSSITQSPPMKVPLALSEYAISQ
jgi:hypothetical protein